MSFLLDTNVLSEARKRQAADARVKAWLGSVSSTELFTSVVVVGEIRRGVERLRRQDVPQATLLEAWLATLQRQFSDRVLPVTLEIAEEWGRLNVPDPLPTIDAYLAATANIHGLILVTRDASELQRRGFPVFNPWSG